MLVTCSLSIPLPSLGTHAPVHDFSMHIYRQPYTLPYTLHTHATNLCARMQYQVLLSVVKAAGAISFLFSFFLSFDYFLFFCLFFFCFLSAFGNTFFFGFDIYVTVGWGTSCQDEAHKGSILRIRSVSPSIFWGGIGNTAAKRARLRGLKELKLFFILRQHTHSHTHRRTHA